MECNNLKVTLNNFQSISDAELCFDEGINVLVGQSNSGKSAVLRAINAALTNPSGAKEYIKNGTTDMSVTLNYLDNEIQWLVNSKKGNKYLINKKEHDRIGTTDSFKLMKDNGFVTDSKGSLMNIEGEWDIPFPFDRNPSEMFKLFENFFSVYNSSVILKKYKELIDKNNSEKIDLERRKNCCNNSIKALEELTSSVDLELLKQGKEVIQELMQQSQEIDKYMSKCVLAHKLSKLKVKTKKFNKEMDLVSEYRNTVNIIKDVSKYISLRTVNVKDKKTFENSQATLEEYNSLKEAEVSTDIYRRIRNIKPKKFNGANTLTSYVELSDDYSKIALALTKLKKLKQQKQDTEDKKTALLEEKSKFKVCPLCGK